MEDKYSNSLHDSKHDYIIILLYYLIHLYVSYSFNNFLLTNGVLNGFLFLFNVLVLVKEHFVSVSVVAPSPTPATTSQRASASPTKPNHRFSLIFRPGIIPGSFSYQFL
jgi:hypothetical protein